MSLSSLAPDTTPRGATPSPLGSLYIPWLWLYLGATAPPSIDSDPDPAPRMQNASMMASVMASCICSCYDSPRVWIPGGYGVGLRPSFSLSLEAATGSSRNAKQFSAVSTPWQEKVTSIIRFAFRWMRSNVQFNLSKLRPRTNKAVQEERCTEGKYTEVQDLFYSKY